MANEQHRPFRMPHESPADFEARVAEHAARIEHASTPERRGPQWQNPNERRKDAPKAARDHAAEARAALQPVDVKTDGIVAAVIVAQALDRLAERIIEAAAVANYKRS